MKILIDAMGGDLAPACAVEGALLAAQRYPDCQLVLVGDEARLLPLLEGKDRTRISLAHAGEVITMEDDPATAVRRKKDSSMAVALAMLAKGEGDAMVSAGSTGALLTGATLVTKRIRGIRRAAIGTMFPQKGGGKALLLDCGANAECTAEYLMQFAYLGHFYMMTQLGIDNPRVGLVNNGTEEHKGDALRKETYQLLKAAHDAGRLNFIGNVEGRDILSGVCDVLVCDGFTGNVILKTVEGCGGFLMGELKGVMLANLKTKLAAAVLKPGLRRFKKMLDYKEVGGAPMLGISKTVVKAHGASDGQAMCSAIGQTVDSVNSGLIRLVEENIELMTVTPKTQGAAEAADTNP